MSNNACVSNKTEDLNLSVFNGITGINELRKLTKHISCQCRFDGRKYNSDQWWNNNKCQCEFKNHHICEKDNVCNPATGSCENRKYLASIMDDTAIIFDEVIDANKDAKSNEEKQKQFQQVLMKKSSLENAKCLCFTCMFINYYSIIDSC